MAIIRVFKQYQTAVSWEAAFSGEVKRVSVIVVQIDGFGKNRSNQHLFDLCQKC